MRFARYLSTRHLLSLGLGVLASTLVTGYFIPPTSRWEWDVLLGLGGVLLAWPSYHVIPVLAKGSLAALSPRARHRAWLACAAGSLLFLGMLPLQAPSPSHQTVRVAFESSLPFLLLWWAAHGAWFAILFATALAFLGRVREPISVRTPIRFRTGFSVITLGGLLYLLALFPGTMTSDSLDQWQQMDSGVLNDNHPVFHTLTNWVLTRPWHSPASIALAQILVFAAVFALLVRELGRMGASRRSQALALGLAALWPLVGVYLVTLWKDIPFSLGVLGLSYCILRMVRTNGASLKTKGGLAGLIVSSLAVLLYRHNGPLVLLLTFGALLCVRVFPRRRLLAIFSVPFIALVLIKGPFYRALEVQPVGAAFKLQNQIHQMSAMVSSGALLTTADRTLLTSIQPLDYWRDRYNCYSAGPTIYNNHFNPVVFENKVSDFIRIFIRLAPANLDALWQRQLCISSLVWRITVPSDGYLSTWALGIDSNTLGLSQHPILPSLRSALGSFDEWSNGVPLVAWMWRPAIYLFLALAAVALASFRSRRPLFLLFALPIVANSLVLMLFTPSQSARYQFCVYLLAILVPVLLGVSNTEKEGVESVSIDESRKQSLVTVT